MGKDTNISWSNHTFNGWIGCTKVSAGCTNCYADAQDKLRKWTPDGWGKGKPRKRTSDAYWQQPLKWNREAADTLQCSFCGERFRDRESPISGRTLHQGESCPVCYDATSNLKAYRPRVFCASLADVFDEEVPDEWRTDLFELIRRTPKLDWLLLTKRPKNILAALKVAEHDASERFPTLFYEIGDWRTGKPPGNVWLGTTVENQDALDERTSLLLQVPAAVHFISAEPLLSPVDFEFDSEVGILSYLKSYDFGEKPTNKISWVICGGESGPKRRPFEIEWAQSLHDQCKTAGVAFWMKQDSHLRSGQQGRLPDALWNCKELPEVNR